MKYIYWIKGGYAGCYRHVKHLSEYALNTANRARMGLAETTPNGAWLKDKVLPEMAAFFGKYDAWEDPAKRTSTIRVELKDAWEALKPDYERLVKILRDSPEEVVTNADLNAMELLPRSSGERHDSPVADKPPGHYVELLSGNRVRVYIYDIDSKHRRGKPAGQQGAEIGYEFYDEDLPVTVEELLRSAFTTRNPYTFNLPGSLKRKYLKFALRWENERGEKGPWSDIDTQIIP